MITLNKIYWFLVILKKQTPVRTCNTERMSLQFFANSFSRSITLIVTIFCFLENNVSFSQNSKNIVQDTVITTFKDQYFDGYNQERMKEFEFPDIQKKRYNKITLHYEVKCPPQGCDTYDRIVSINVVKNKDNNTKETFEIARIITAGGKECSWDIDVSDYVSLLSNKVTLHHYISTQNMEGKGIFATLTFTFAKTTPTYTPFIIQNIINNNPYQRWSANEYYNELEQNLITKNIAIDPKAEKVFIKTTITGHGLAQDTKKKNIYAKQYIAVDYQHFFLDSIPCNNCKSSVCTDDTSGGVGWCPGTQVYSWKLDITDFSLPAMSDHTDTDGVQAGVNKKTISVRYNLQPTSCFSDTWYMIQSQIIEYKKEY